jgi:ribokinase
MEASDAPVIAVVGSTMMDMVAYTPRVPVAGETLVGDRFVLGFGGKGANQAVAASRFGASVSMVNAVGSDDFGGMHLENFARQGINCDHVIRKPGSSGVAPIWVEPDGSNRIIIVPGANNLLTPEEAIHAVQALAPLDVVIGQFEIPQEVTAEAFSEARKRGAVTVLNPAPSATITPELLHVTDWLIPNEVEFAALHPQGASPDSDEAIVQLAQTYKVRVCVTLGSLGAALVTQGGDVVRIPAPSVRAIDTTGAGDCFVGAFAYALATGLTEESAVALACAAASLSVQREGTQTSFPKPEEAVALLETFIQ